MGRALGALERGALQLTPQPDDGVTYAEQDRQGRDAHRLAPSLATRCTTTSAACRRFPAPGSRLLARGRRCASRCCARRRATAAARPARVLDDKLTIACGDGAVRLLELQRAGKQPMTADEFLRGTPRRAGAACSADTMPRYKLIIEYDGTPFAAGKIQDDAPTRAGRDRGGDRAVRPAKRVTIQGAGRTDAGVHALGQVAHFDLRSERDGDTVRDALNAHLRPHPVAVLSAERVREDFDARFSATRRHYLYRIVNRRPDLALDAGRAWRVPRPLDAAAMHEAAQRLVGQHDFTTFRSTECQAKSPVKTLDRLDVEARRRRA